MSDEFFHGVDKAVETLSLGNSGARLDELMKLSHELISALDVEQAMAAAGEAIRQVCDAERFVVLLVTPEGLVAKAARDAAGVDLALPPTVEADACEKARATGEIVTRFRSGKLVGLCAVPMVGASGCVGVLYADGEARFAQSLDPHAREMLLLLASQAALAVNNAAMLSQVRAATPGQLDSAAAFERKLHDELQRAARYKRPFSLLCVDIDGAEQLLARYNVGALDELAATVGLAIVSEARETDIVARLGPARIGVILPEPTDGFGDVASLRRFADRIRGRITGAVVAGIPQKVTLMFGGVAYQQAPLIGLKGVMHEVDLAIAAATRSRADHFTTR